MGIFSGSGFPNTSGGSTNINQDGFQSLTYNAGANTITISGSNSTVNLSDLDVTNSSLVLDGSNILTLTDTAGSTVVADLSSLSGSFVELTAPSQTITGNIIIDGDFTVSGANTLTAPEAVAVEDNLLYLNSNWGSGTAPTEDSGFVINRGLDAGSGEETVGLIWNETSDEFELGFFGAEDGTSTALTLSSKAPLSVGAAKTESLSIENATTEIGSPTSDAEVLVRDSSTGQVKHINFSEFGTVKQGIGDIIGDGVTSTFVFTHNRDNEYVLHELIDASTKETVITDIVRTDANNIQVSWAHPPIVGENYKIVVIG